MAPNSSVNISAILSNGGEDRVTLLRYCVMSITMEPVFVFLTKEYRMCPTHVAALGLYDIFCAPGAVARIHAQSVLPPRHLKLLAAADAIREQWGRLQSRDQQEPPSESITTPHRNLFDVVAEAVEKDPEGNFAQLSRRYDLALCPQDNLPGGRMNAVQRHFVDRIWRPIARPRLVEAGFWRIANIE